jgi:hypothetical protein
MHMYAHVLMSTFMKEDTQGVVTCGSGDQPTLSAQDQGIPEMQDFNTGQVSGS